MSKRGIAAEVFGDGRYHGRVERILRRPPPPRPQLDEESAEDATLAKDSRALFRELLNRHREQLATADELPSLKEIELLMKLERQLEVAETVERLNALTRGRAAEVPLDVPPPRLSTLLAKCDGGLLRRQRARHREGAPTHQRPPIRSQQRLGQRETQQRLGQREPNAHAENAYLASHPWQEYGESHLGLTAGASGRNKSPLGLRLRRFPPPPPHGADRLPLPRGRVAPQGDRARGARPSAAPRPVSGHLAPANRGRPCASMLERSPRARSGLQVAPALKLPGCP